MLLTQDQADELIVNVAVAALSYSRDYAVLDEGRTLFADVSAAMAGVVDAGLEDEDRDRLRVMVGRAIDDPTEYREEFMNFVLDAIAPSSSE